MITAEDSIISQIGLDLKPIKPSEALLNRLSKLNKKYRTEIRNWLASSKETKYKPEVLDYETVVETLDTFNPEDAANIFKAWDKQAELSLELTDKIEQLKAVQPINQSITLFGVEDRPPSLFEQKKWLIYVRIFNAPEAVLDALNAGLLTGIEVEALGLIYPSILDTLQQAVIEGIAELKGKGIKGLGLKKMKLVNTLLQVPRLSPEQFESLQAQYLKEEEGADINVDGEAVQTDTQRVQFK